jgi:hypothetical protein
MKRSDQPVVTPPTKKGIRSPPPLTRRQRRCRVASSASVAFKTPKSRVSYVFLPHPCWSSSSEESSSEDETEVSFGSAQRRLF